MTTGSTQRPLRILTIDNGGLQAISILDILKEVCHELSSAEGYSSPKRPHELFDIIAGVGTGGWLAILLGRYKLDIQQCLTVYMSIANSISPSKVPAKSKQRNKTSTAISQKDLQREIERVIASKGLGEHLIDQDEANGKTVASNDRDCHAFAVGPIKRGVGQSERQRYHLFRTYRMPATSTSKPTQGPDPGSCKVSMACLATAAAKDFLDECRIDGTTYWDRDFPKTHNITFMALEEAKTLFGSNFTLESVVNISPGLPSSAEIDSLLVAGKRSRKSSMSRPRLGEILRKVKSACDVTSPPMVNMMPCVRQNSDPLSGPKKLVASPTTSSVSSDASETEKGHQKLIRDHIEAVYESSEKYVRLEMTAPSGEEKPYLDDIYQTKLSARLVQKFLEQAKDDIHHIGAMCKASKQNQLPQKLPYCAGLSPAEIKATLPFLETAVQQRVN